MSDRMGHLTPRHIVAELDRYIVGQGEAKRAVAIAIRNRWRRQQLSDELRNDVLPKNIIMIGPTGVGKTEIARRLAGLVGAPFVKVEASKFTEVGYVGRDVESMIRDLTDCAMGIVKAEQIEAEAPAAARRAEERILDALLPKPPPSSEIEADTAPDRSERSRERLRQMLRDGKLDERDVEIRVETAGSIPSVEVFSGQGVEHMGFDFKNLFEKMAPRRSVDRRLTVKEAMAALKDEEAERLLDAEKVRQEAMERVEQSGIVFIDEIDKVSGREGGGSGPDVSREGVQRDLLPIVEGSSVSTRHGMVKTDHILFIAAGAFHVSKPADLIPELQGRFPIRVELSSLGQADFLKILREPRNALTRQYAALLDTEGLEVEFTDDALEGLAALASRVNESSQNIGARRLHTLFEKLLEEDLFDAPDRRGEKLRVDAKMVKEKLGAIAEDQDMSRYIL